MHYYLFAHSHSSQLTYATLTVLLTIYVAIVLHDVISIILRGVANGAIVLWGMVISGVVLGGVVQGTWS